MKSKHSKQLRWGLLAVFLCVALGKVACGVPVTALLPSTPCKTDSECPEGFQCYLYICAAIFSFPGIENNTQRDAGGPDFQPPPDNRTTPSEPSTPDLNPPPVCQSNQTQPCYYGPQGTQNVGSCKAGVHRCVNGQWDFTVCEGQILPVFESNCNDNIDNDCDGKIDAQDEDCKQCTAGATAECGHPLIGECVPGQKTCDANGQWGSCEGGQGPANEICDGKDNDCNGQIDEIFKDKDKPCFVGAGDCRGEGVWRCKADGSGVECPAQAGQGQPEQCDGKDNDCNGAIDDNVQFPDPNCPTGLSGPCAKGVWGCQNGKPECLPSVSPTPEICNDNIDNDCDGKIDAQDEDCQNPIPGAKPCAICSKDSDCGAGGVCRTYPTTAYPTKYCFPACTSSQSCGKGFQCAELPGVPNGKYCRPPPYPGNSQISVWYCDGYSSAVSNKRCGWTGDCGWSSGGLSNGWRGAICLWDGSSKKCYVHCISDNDCPVGKCNSTRNGSYGKICN